MPRVAELKDQVDRIWLASFHTDLADTLTQQLRQQALLGVQATLEAALREEVAGYRHQLRTAARASGRTPSTFRCAGSYRRRVLTTYGLIPDLCVPKLRSGNAERPWQILTRSTPPCPPKKLPAMDCLAWKTTTETSPPIGTRIPPAGRRSTTSQSYGVKSLREA